MGILIREAATSDITAIKKLLEGSPALCTDSLLREIVDHVTKKECKTKVLFIDSVLLGVWLSKEFDTYTSLSFFFIAEEIRKKLVVLTFFQECLKVLSTDRPLYIKSKDITGFERYVAPVANNPDVYVFKGFR